ncbi:mCG1031076 [Mus musculus]|nr:mCG1031076 [Mus musculus]
MADASSTPMSAQQCPPSSAVMDQHLYPLDQPEVLLHTDPQQGIFQVPQVPLMLSLPTTVINMSCIPVILNFQMIPSFPWSPSQPMAIPCLFPNVIMHPSTNTATPVMLAQVLHPATANQVPVIWAQSNTFNQVPEVYTQGPVTSTQGSSSAEEHRQKVMDAAEALLILHNSQEALQETSTTPDWKESTVHKHETRPPKTPREGSSQDTLMRSKPQEPSVLPYAPVTQQQQSVISYSAKNLGPIARPKRYSSVIVQNCAVPEPLLLQPQVLTKWWDPGPLEGMSLVDGTNRKLGVPDATKQDSVFAAIEWKRKLEFAEALMALRNSPLPPPVSASPKRRGKMTNTYLPGHGTQDQHLYPLDQPEVLLHTGPQQGIFQGPLMLSLPTPVINISCIPVTLNLQMTHSFSWNPRQPMTIPCLFPNVIMQPSTSTAAPVVLAQVLKRESQATRVESENIKGKTAGMTGTQTWKTFTTENRDVRCSSLSRA